MSSFMNAVNKYRRAHWLEQHHLKPLARLYEMWIYLFTTALSLPHVK